MGKMKIAFFSNFLNHHQALVADELYRQTNGNYTFVETIPMPEWIVKSGYPDYSEKPYLFQAWKSEEAMKAAWQLAIDVDVALFAGFEVLEFEKYRISSTDKITFDVSERWLKRGMLNILSPRILRLYYAYKKGGWERKPVYKLCSSAFAADDHYRLNMYIGKCFKWGYFTDVSLEDPDFKFQVVGSTSTNPTQTPTSCAPVMMMWCARFLWWKHPELPIKLAESLQRQGYSFHIDMFGTGEKLEEMKALATKLGVNNVLTFHGNKANADILQEMRKHDIFLFTSDKNEGWGAVANEAMSQGCALVGADAIGSVPYLITDNGNGLIFKSCDFKSFEQKVIQLLENAEYRYTLSRNGIKTMKEVWSPQNAARSLLRLISDLQNNSKPSVIQGPCSKA